MKTKCDSWCREEYDIDSWPTVGVRESDKATYALRSAKYSTLSAPPPQKNNKYVKVAIFMGHIMAVEKISRVLIIAE